MNMPASFVTQVSRIASADDRFISVNGPPITRLPNWGLTLKTEENEYHLHPAIRYEVHYQLPDYIFVHTFNGALGRSAEGDEPMGPWTADAHGSCLVPPGYRMRLVQQTPLEFLAIGISQRFMNRVSSQMGVECQFADKMIKTIDPALASISAEIRRCMIAEPVAIGSYLDALTTALLTRLITEQSAGTDDVLLAKESLSPNLARRLAQAIDEGISGSIQVTALADKTGLSRSHFSRAFSHTFGMPPKQYINSRRLARARTLLTDTEESVTDIAMQCGFSSPSHLTSAFKEELGVTPTAYRASLQEKSASAIINTP